MIMSTSPAPPPSDSLGSRIAGTPHANGDDAAGARRTGGHQSGGALEPGIRAQRSRRTHRRPAGRGIRLEPHDLVAGTDYPAAKADRLPLAVARHTRAELLEALFRRDLTWLEGAPPNVAVRVMEQWRSDLAVELDATRDPRECERLESLLRIAVSEFPN